MSQRGEGLTDILRQAERVLIPLHVSPDGDSMGSALAMAWACRQLGAEPVVVSADPIPEKYQFLLGDEPILSPDNSRGSYDLLLLLDCSSLDRIGRARDLIPTKQPIRIATIDHHAQAGGLGDWVWMDPSAAAPAEMILDWMETVPLVPPAEVARALYTAIATDTGFFAFSNTKPETLARAARLLRSGVSPDEVASAIQASRRLGELRILGRTLQHLQTNEADTVIWSYLTAEDFEQCEADAEDTESLIQVLRTLKSAEVALMFTEYRDHKTKISFRSRGAVDVSVVAALFGGGGHQRAAGASLRMSLDRALDQVLPEVMRRLPAEGGCIRGRSD